MTKYFYCLGYKILQKDLHFGGTDIFIAAIIYFWGISELRAFAGRAVSTNCFEKMHLLFWNC